MPLRRRLESISVAVAGNRATWAAAGISRHGVILRQIYDSGRPSGTTLLFTRDQWATFLDEVIHARPSDNGAVVVRHGEEVHSYPHGGEYVSHWHLEGVETGGTLHFHADDWDAFQRAAAAGDLVVPAGRARDFWPAITLLLGLCLLAAGLVAWPFAGGRWAALGAAAAGAVVATGLYRRLISQAWPREVEQRYADRDRLWDKAYFLVPEAVALLGVGVPALAGVAVGLATGDWRWTVTGLVVGTALPALVVLIALGVGSGSLSAGHLLLGGLLLVGGVPTVLLGWMWSADARWLLIGGAAIVALIILELLAASSSVLRGD
ncbi:hypothetical protein ACIBL3_42715 [Kribbella sp. NPDC050124]|uniref:hypothetical protein n=1 Tax=Kribbella sp. NPDC050124 TaxID=3364114 RepID=UPI0037ACFD0E